MKQGDYFHTSFYDLKKLNMRFKQAVCSLISISFDDLQLAYYKNKLYVSLDY